MTSRRRFVLAGALCALNPQCARARARLPRIGILSGLPLEKSAAAPALLKALAELGYREKTEMLLEYRYSHDPAEFPALAKELVAAKCDVMFALVSEFTARAFRDARSSIPVVFLAPGAKRFLVLADVNTKDQLAALRAAAAKQRVQLTVVEYARPPYDFAAGFETGRREKVDALILFFSPEFTGNRAKLSALFTSYKLPTIASGVMAEASGVLIGYSPNQARLYRRAAEIGMQILKGGKAAEIPVEQPREFDVVVNLKTAKALGVKIPQSVMARATKVIE